ncbi:MAG: hypothetical protein OEZ65_15915 [Gemmatimonadota bacterium]|nr:hypothetical protein [Gemmatimonadota bacterium]
MSSRAELEFRDSILDRMEADEARGTLLDRLRGAMLLLYAARQRDPEWLANHAKHGRAYVTATDAREELESWPDVPPAEQLNRNFMGGLFRKGWRAVGFHPSGTNGSHGRREMMWEPK